MDTRFRRAAVLAGVGACAAPAVTPTERPREVVVAPQDAAAPAVADEPDEGAPYAGDASVDRGETKIVDGRAIFRDAKDRLRARDVKAREVLGTEQRSVRLTLGDRVAYGAWDVRWSAVREGLIVLEGRRRGVATGEWSTSTDERIATHDLRTRDHLFTFQVRLVATHGQSDRADGAVEITGRESELAPGAKLGQSLKPGVYAFPGGLRVHVERTEMCDYDPSAPCPFGGSYRADAALGDQEAHVKLTAKQTKVLSHTIELAFESFTVRK